MPKFLIALDDETYGELAHLACTERRTTRGQAEWLLTQAMRTRQKEAEALRMLEPPVRGGLAPEPCCGTRRMALNPTLFTALESHGMTDDHLRQLLAVCDHGSARATWHIDPNGFFAKLEIAFFAKMSDTRSMRQLTQLLQKER